jgi:hypothetical protein
MASSPAPGSAWRSEPLGAVSAWCFRPGGPPVGTVLVLSDIDRPLAGDLRDLATPLEERQLAAVAPDVRSWWIERPEPSLPGWASPLEFIAKVVTPWLQKSEPQAQRFAVLGGGFGGQGALQVGYRFPGPFPIVAAVTPAIDFHRHHSQSAELQGWFDSSERARQETATLRLHPLNWPPHQWISCPPDDWRFDGCERLASKLTSIGIPFTADFGSRESPDDRLRRFERALDFIAECFREPPASRQIRFR